MLGIVLPDDGEIGQERVPHDAGEVAADRFRQASLGGDAGGLADRVEGREGGVAIGDAVQVAIRDKLLKAKVVKPLFARNGQSQLQGV